MAWFLGGCAALSVLLLMFGRHLQVTERERLRLRSLRGVFQNANRKKVIDQLYADLVRYAEFLGRPEWADHVYRWSLALTIGCAILILLTGTWYLMPLLTIVFLAPYFWLRGRYRSTHLKLKRQLRETRLLLAYLVKAGAPIEEALRTVTEASENPLRPYLEDVCLAIGTSGGDLRLHTVFGAFSQLAERVNTPEMTQFAQLLTQHSQYDTPLAETLLKSLEIERRVRDANAEAVYGKAQSKVALIMTGFMGIPAFVFLIFAACSYFLKVMSGSGLA